MTILHSLGQQRTFGETSAPGGEADELGAKADSGARMTRAAILALVLALGPAVALAGASAS